MLGDKTRMARLAADPHAYIRPCPSAGTLGGVARATSQAMLGARGGGVRRGAGRDRRRRPVRGHRRRHGRHLPVPDPGPHRRPAPGHQEGHPRDRRRDRGQQGRRRPRGRRPGRPPASSPARCAWCTRSRRVGAAVVTCSALDRRRRRRRVAAGARPPRAASAPTAWPRSAPTSSSTSPGRWSATSSSSGCGARRASRRSATRSGGACSPASCRRPLAADRILAAYDGIGRSTTRDRAGRRSPRVASPQCPDDVSRGRPLILDPNAAPLRDALIDVAGRQARRRARRAPPRPARPPRAVLGGEPHHRRGRRAASSEAGLARHAGCRAPA